MTIIILTSGTTWTVPSDWNSTNNTIEVWGAGGGATGDGSFGSGGGAGGNYTAITNLALTAGATVHYSIGAGGLCFDLPGNNPYNGGTGGNTYFNGTSITACSVSAKGGTGGGYGTDPSSAGSTGGQGQPGSLTGIVGTTKFSGGAGGRGGNNVSFGGGGGPGGGGGGSAGPAGNGVVGVGNNTTTYFGSNGGAGNAGSGIGAGGIGCQVTNGAGGVGGSQANGGGGGGGGGAGSGGDGSATQESGGSGGFPGGGAGGGGNVAPGTSAWQGGGGQIRITYSSGGPPPPPVTRKRRIVNAVSTVTITNDTSGYGGSPGTTGSSNPPPSNTFVIGTITHASTSAPSSTLVADTPSDGSRMFGNGVAFSMVITSNTSSADTIVYSVADTWGHVVASGTTSVSSGPIATTIACTSTLSGYFCLTAKLQNANVSITTGGTMPAGFVTFGVLPALTSILPTPTYSHIDQHRFGIQGWNDNAPVLNALGITQTIDDRQMSFEEPNAENTFNPASNDLDPFYPANTNIMRLVRLDGVPPYALANQNANQDSFAPTDLTYYQNYMSRVGTETEKVRSTYYTNQTRNFYQVTWEPDVLWADTDAHLISMYQSVFNGLHSTDPNALAMGPTCSFPTQTLAWLQRLQPLGFFNYIDGIATHGYYNAGTFPEQPPEQRGSSSDPATAANGLSQSIFNLRAYMQSNKANMKLYQTEMGIGYNFPYNYGNAAINQNYLYAHAAVVARAQLIFLGEGVDVTYPFFGPDYPQESNGSAGYGTYFSVNLPQGDDGSTNNSPKPAAGALAAMTRVLDGTTTLGRVNTIFNVADGGVFAYAFQRLGGGKIVTALWTHNNSQWPVGSVFSQTYSVSTVLQVDAPGTSGTVQVIDFMGNATTVNYTNGNLTISIYEHPQYVVSTNATIAKQNSTVPVGYTASN